MSKLLATALPWGMHSANRHEPDSASRCQGSKAQGADRMTHPSCHAQVLLHRKTINERGFMDLPYGFLNGNEAGSGFPDNAVNRRPGAHTLLAVHENLMSGV